MGTLEGRVAIVTGGGRGIGAAIARRFAAEGAAVVINDLGTAADGTGGDAGPAAQVATEITADGGRAVADGGDVADTATGQRLVEAAVDTFGGLDVLVNVAGILRDRMIFNLAEEDWDAVIRVHLRGHYSTIRPASAYFRQQRNPRGHYRIINFTSRSGLEGSPGQPNYAAAKMGIVGLTYSVAQALAKYGVTANAISPTAATRLVATVADGRDLPPELAADNVAPLAAYLAGTRSDWLTGRVLSSAAHRVGLYANPAEIAEIDADTPWETGKLGDEIEAKFRPLAEGLPYSVFTAGR
jgi:NAD(P)-dependent dehydrogenase (short-subunit alcohol dehydrogenase family)